MNLSKKRPHVDSFKKGDLVYCLNNGEGEYILSIDLVNGKTDTAYIPRTFIPVELTAYTSVEGLQNSQDVRHAIRKGAIILLHQDEAESMLNTEEAKAEIKSLQSKNKSFMTTLDEFTVDESPVDALLNEDDKVSIKVKSILIDTEKSDQDKYNDLVREHKMNGLNEDDLNYVLVTSTDSKIQTWASTKLKKFKK